MTSVLSFAALLRGVGSKLRTGRRCGRKPAAAGRAIYAEALEQRCLLSAYVMTDLSILAGGEGSATAINDAGQVIGSYFAGGAEHAFMYDPSEPIDKRMIALTGVNPSRATAINDAGQVAGWFDAADGKHAFVYDSRYGTSADSGALGNGSLDVRAINGAVDIYS